jgi:hypothetical protein
LAVNNLLNKHKKYVFASLLYLLTAGILLIASLILNHGHFVYALDDPYIHMTLAKNFVSNGHWAVNGSDFSSSSSSPLWTLIISAVYYVLGVNVITPFILNIIFGLITILIAYVILKKFNIEKYILFILLAVIYVPPMPTIMFTGMEHTAQIAFTLLFVYLSSKLIAEEGKDYKNLITILFITPIITGLRYEDFFFVLVVCALLAIRKKFLFSALILVFGLSPILIYGFISVSHGWLFIPNTILVKSKLPELSILYIPKTIFRACKNMLEPHMLVLLSAGTFTFIYSYLKKRTVWFQKQVMLLIFLLGAILHETFAQNGWFFRYEAYLVAMGILVIFINLYDLLPENFSFRLFKEKFMDSGLKKFAVITYAAPLVMWALTALLVPLSTNNIYDQHYQMGLFVKNYAKGINIAANDIGIISFYSNNNILDLWGLADMEAGRDRITKTYTTNKISSLAKSKNIKLAILYEHWFDQYGGLPPSWEKLGEWTITDFNETCGTETVSFYAVDTSQAENLRTKLQEFSAQLPASDIYKIFN